MGKKKYICPICGYDQLDEPAYDEFNCSSFDICPCCDTEYGYTDASISHDDLRKKWISRGKPWLSRVVSRPKDWNPTEQLKNVLKENNE